MNAEKMIRMASEWDKRGYYRVGDKKFYNKAQAILACQQIGPEHWPDFIFNDAQFGSAQWQQEPQESIQEIYKQRAQQLRDKYDYLVLSYSSGSDSSNILHTFLNNNIRIDEVFSYGPFSTNQGQTGQLTRNAENNFREIDLVALPYLRELSKRHKFKVTMYDWTNDMANGFKDSDWIWTESQSRLSPSIVVRNRLHNARSHLNLVDTGKKVGFIFGIDKPKITIMNNEYYMYFLDLDLNMGVGPGAPMTGSEWEYDEYFYWTPDLPQLAVKQAHMLKKFFESTPALKYLITDAHLGTWNAQYKEQYFDVVKRLIYPGFNPGIWQTHKISSLTYTEHDNWFINDPNLKARDHWLAGLRELQRLIDPKFFNKGTVDAGYIGSFSKWYKIG
jgi:hypothetical protein